ncbi:MAG: AtpZ/AtpI family protein [Deltaproteobacteria bacterium]|nr:AtpZ/AtpI family protein [Deltaproteobacteria bacterium]
MASDKYYKSLFKEMTLVTQLGLTMVGSILLCFAVGYFLDKWLGTRGIFLIIFIILGVIGGGWTVYRQIMQLDEESKNNNSP